MKKQKVTFSDCLKTFTIDQDKAISPEETVKRFYAKLEKPNIKILSEVKRIDNGRLDIPVYFSVCGEDAVNIIGTKKQMGKGASPMQAKASACMELAERFSFFSFKNSAANFITGDYAAMRSQGYPVMELHYLLQSVHDEKTDEATLERLLAEIPMQWTWATNITKNEEVLIPFSWFYAINEFNGPSAGNTYEEAALQGISEIVERHVCSVITHNQMATPTIDPDSVQDPVARKLIDTFEKNGIQLYLNDFSLNTGICTVGALAVDPATFPEKSEIVYTAGTTPDAEKAIIRAITEVAQLAGDFNSNSNYVASGLPKPLSLAEVEYVTNPGLHTTVSRMNDLSHNNIKVEVENCTAALEKIGMDIFMIDVAHEDLEIPALYTIIPGAHFRERSMIRSVGLFAAKLVVELIDNPGEIEEALDRMSEVSPDTYYVEFYRGRNLFNLELYEEALPHFEKSLLLDPEKEDLPYIYSYQGNCLSKIGQYDAAIAALIKGCHEDDERPDLYNLLGVCYFKKELYEKAIECFKRAVDLNPTSAMDYANLGVNYAKLGKDNEAVQFFTLALTLDSSLDFAQDYLDRLLAEKQK
ncbi:YcaO-like family protein [Desulfopila inferna]|uniref:YcaO-like family protein n=1 Tax=Desulfopila inferna TaxID=468528 RepID=UPI0019669A6B|nr:YcaO-like family protein [Desulfopila inferna]MBM9602858.1 YcaO-like family protein [Desulfopila inferna]